MLEQFDPLVNRSAVGPRELDLEAELPALPRPFLHETLSSRPSNRAQEAARPFVPVTRPETPPTIGVSVPSCAIAKASMLWLTPLRT